MKIEISNLTFEDYKNLSKEDRRNLPYIFEERISIMRETGYTLKMCFEHAKIIYLEQQRGISA